MDIAKIKRFLLGTTLVGGLIAGGAALSRGGKTKEKQKDKIENATLKNDTVKDKEKIERAAPDADAKSSINANDKYDNVALFEASRSKIKFALAFVENYSPDAYFCGEAWTLGHGLTILYNPDGSSRAVVPGDKCTLEQSDVYKGRYLTYEVLRDIKQYIHVPIDESTLITTCVFRYCVGRTNFKKSQFLKQLNAGATGAELAKYLTGFRKQKGVLKRCYFFAALMSGEITFDDLTDLRAEGCYNLNIVDICKCNSNGRLLKDADNMAMWDFSKLAENLNKAKQPRKSAIGECKLTREIVPEYIVQEVISARGGSRSRKAANITMAQSATMLHNDALQKYRIGDYAGALKLLKDLSKTDYNNASLQNDMSLVYYDAGDMRRALAAAKDAFKLATKPTDKSAALYNIGMVYAARGEYKDAIEYYDRALEQVNNKATRNARAVAMENLIKADASKAATNGKKVAFVIGAAVLGAGAKKYVTKKYIRGAKKQAVRA